VTFLAPIAGAVLAASLIPPLIALYILRLRRRPRAVSSTLLWLHAVEDLQANAPFQRLRRNLLLLLQLIAILLLAAAVMQPQSRGGAPAGGRLVLFIDVSASMNVPDGPGGRTRLEQARRLARERIDNIYAGSLFRRGGAETMIITFGDRAEVVCRFSRSRSELLDAIDRIQPTDGETRIAEALKLARAYMTNVDPDSDRPIGDPGAWELFSDGRIADLDEEVLRGESLIYHRVGETEAPNAGIISLSVDRPIDRPSAVEIFVSVVNWSRAEMRREVQLSVNGSARALREIVIPPQEIDRASGRPSPGRASLAFAPFEEPRGAVIEVALIGSDALAADDVAWAVLPPPRALRVALVAPRNVAVADALGGLELQQLVRLTPERYLDLTSRGEIDTFDVVVLDGWVPEDESGMPPGRYLVFGSPPPVRGIEMRGSTGPQMVLSTRSDHPVMRYASMDQIVIGDAVDVAVAADVLALAESRDGPLIMQVSRGAQQVIYVAFNVHASTWPFERSFVNFVYDSVDFLGRSGTGLTEQSLRPGDVIVARLPSSATSMTLSLPDGSIERPVVHDPALFSWGPIRRVGLHTLGWRDALHDEPQIRVFASSMLSEQESDVDAADEIGIGGTRISDRTGSSMLYTPLWPFAILFTLAVLMLEWWLYNRRTRL